MDGEIRPTLGGVALVCAGVFLGLSLVSWHPHDPQVLPNAPVNQRTANICGVLGAYGSSYAYATHGLTAFGVAGWLIACGVAVFKGSTRRAAKELASSAILLVWFSVALQFSGEKLGERVSVMCPLGPGGAFGLWPAAAMLRSLGWAGTAIALSAGLIGILYVLGLHSSLYALLKRVPAAWRVPKREPAAPVRSNSPRKAPAPASRPLVRIEKKPRPAPKKREEIKTSPLSAHGPRQASFDPSRASLSTPPSTGSGPEPADGNSRPRGGSNDKLTARAGRGQAASPSNDGLPPLKLLDKGANVVGLSHDELEQKGTVLIGALREYGIECDLVAVESGPTVTTFELRPAPGVDVKKIDNQSKNLSVRLKSAQVRLVAPIPGRDTIAIEVPNPEMQDVRLRSLLESEQYKAGAAKCCVPIALGMDSAGGPLAFDLAEMPHLLVAGATNAGKSVCLNTIILSILMQRTPAQVQLMIVDPKQIELRIYEAIPHLAGQIVSNPQGAMTIFNSVVNKMEERYEFLKQFSGIRDVPEYNRLPKRRRAEAYRGEGDVLDLPDSLPHIVVVVDEFQDIMHLSSKEIESAVQRLSQKARAAGIHLILATQRPSVDVVTGTIKGNLTARISFQVAAMMDSRTILDRPGAEKLLGRGDMLVSLPTSPGIARGRCAYVTSEEAMRVVDYLKKHGSTLPDELPPPAPTVSVGKASTDDLYEQACRLVLSSGQASPTMLQSRLSVGYARAGKLIDAMSSEGLVTQWTGGKPRRVCMTLDEWQKKRKNPAA